MNARRMSTSAPRSAASPLRRHLTWLAPAAAVGAALAAVAYYNRPQSLPPVLPVEVLAQYPHATDAFTQGLLFDDGVLYESTGHYGQSRLRRVNLETGEVLQEVPLNRRYFAEGIAIVGDEIYLLTWKEGVAFVYDKATLEEKRRINYQGEGWGLTYNGRHLIQSDGSATLQFRDPVTFEVVRTLDVTSGGQPLAYLNELEYIDGLIYANVWYYDHIARIDPQTGNVTSWLDLSALKPPSADREAVLNGIAYDQSTGRIFATGKLWPYLYEIRPAAISPNK